MNHISYYDETLWCLRAECITLMPVWFAGGTQIITLRGLLGTKHPWEHVYMLYMYGLLAARMPSSHCARSRCAIYACQGIAISNVFIPGIYTACDNMLPILLYLGSCTPNVALFRSANNSSTLYHVEDVRSLTETCAFLNDHVIVIVMQTYRESLTVHRRI
jgi:hypothetical protein